MKKENFRNIGTILLLMVLFASCSLEVKKAIAPTDPPQVEKNVFSASEIRGHYQTDGSPKMFKWPVEKWNSDETRLIPMSFSEKVYARQLITGYSEDVETFTLQYTEMEQSIVQKYETLSKDLESDFLANRCYSYCDPDSLFCDPSDDSVLEVDDWKVGETEEEAAIISSCQENQSQRENIDDDFDREIEQKVQPLRIKAGEAALALLQTVGDRNYFDEITSFEFFYGPYLCLEGEGCRRDEALKNDNVYVRIKFGELVLTNFEGNTNELRVYDLQLDPSQGFLVFKTPAIDFENSNTVYGEITYDLEFISGNNMLRVDGDIRVLENQSKTEKIGRFSSAGQLTRE